MNDFFFRSRSIPRPRWARHSPLSSKTELFVIQPEALATRHCLLVSAVSSTLMNKGNSSFKSHQFPEALLLLIVSFLASRHEAIGFIRNCLGKVKIKIRRKQSAFRKKPWYLYQASYQIIYSLHPETVPFTDVYQYWWRRKAETE